MENIRGEDYFIRWGGEEFLILSPHSSLEGAILFAEKLRVLAQDSVFAQNVRATLIFGVTTLNLDNPEENKESFIKRSDDAMYKAKSNGRNRVKSVV